MRHPTRLELLLSGSRRIILLDLNTSDGHQNPQIWALLKISGMPCYVLFRRDLHPLLLLLIYGQTCRIHGVNYLQNYALHQSNPCHVVLQHFYVFGGATRY
ncbi:hypothetical protein TNCV_1989421 [Trichonephila clavipes]|nr:hypothetical protein TNCV_1989421 [Trichonephila clavipes]